MAGGKSETTKTAVKGKAKRAAAVVVDTTPTPPPAPKDKTAPKPGRRTGRPKGSRNRPETPGRVVAIGVVAPSLDDVLKEPESAKPDGYQFGRPTDYRAEYAAIARAMCKMGATDYELAMELDVTTDTIWRWRSKYPDFSDALSEGKDAWDNRAERSLAMRAVGYSIHTEKLFNYEGTVVRAQTVEHFPPDVGALKMWLGNRRPDKWKDKQTVTMDGTDAFLNLWRQISDGTLPA